MSQIEQYIKNRRKSMKISIAGMSALTKIPVSTYQRKEKTAFDSDDLIKIAKALDFGIILLPSDSNIRVI